MAVPAATPVTTPEAFTVAMPVLRLLHTPDGVASARAVVLFTHTLRAPVMGEDAGSGFTVTVIVLRVALQLFELLMITDTLSPLASVLFVYVDEAPF